MPDPQHGPQPQEQSEPDAPVAPVAPPLPPGRTVELPGRGRTFVREIWGPPRAPTVLLLHGWSATADLNWFRCYEPLGTRYRVLAMDLRGHGHGLRSRRLFRLADCADDAAALADVLGVGRFIPIGYSMGGAVAQLIWQRHRARVSGVVLCATGERFTGDRQESWALRGLGNAAAAFRLAPGPARQRVADRLVERRARRGWQEWALNETRQHDWPTVLRAARELATFSSAAWIGELDVPCSVVVTTEDRVVPLSRQEHLVQSIPGAVRFDVHAGHEACVNQFDLFMPALLDACSSVVTRGGGS